MKEYVSRKLIKSEDLNHHGTLFAGRTAEWFVEACFVTAAMTTKNPPGILCVNIHGLVFKSPIYKGDIIRLATKIADVGTTRLVVYGEIRAENREMKPVEGFITFVHVDDDGKKLPHGIVLDETTDEKELEIRAKAKELKK